MHEITDGVLLEKVRTVLRGRLGAEIGTLDADANLALALGERYDSLAVMECVAALEGEFDFEVDFVAHDVRHWFSTLGRMAQFIGGELEDRAVLGSAG
jgi:acyl carrier protein